MPACRTVIAPALVHALNNLHKALHTARHLLEPHLPPKAPSTFFHVSDGIIALAPELLWIELTTCESDRRTATMRGQPRGS